MGEPDDGDVVGAGVGDVERRAVRRDGERVGRRSRGASGEGRSEIVRSTSLVLVSTTAMLSASLLAT